MFRLGLCLVVLLVLTAGGGAAAPRVPLDACTLAGGIEALCGKVAVAEDRGRHDGPRVSLRVAVLPARDATRRKPDPIVYITGGPGGSAIAGATGVSSIFHAQNARRDIVLVDQRGTGGSKRLECPTPRTQLGTAAAVKRFVEACLADLDADPRRYGTVTAMDDLAEVLAALGYSEVNVYGVSYGATAAQYLLAQHPELVRTAILDGATLLDVPIFDLWARNGDRALRAILARCANARRCARAYPRVRREAFEVIAALRREPVRAGGMLIDAATAAGALHALSLRPEDAAQIPWVAHRARLGDWVPLELTIDRFVTGAPAARSVMFWTIVCNEPWARRNPRAAASRGTYLAERAATDAQLVSAVCAAMPTAPQPAWSSRRVRSVKPVLLVVGGADPQDPLANVAGAARELPNSRTIVVPAAGHASLQLGCLPRVAAQFIDRGSAARLDVGCAARYRPPPFFVR